MSLTSMRGVTEADAAPARRYAPVIRAFLRKLGLMKLTRSVLPLWAT